MKYLFFILFFTIMNFSFSQNSFVLILEQSKDIGEIKSIDVMNTNNKYLKLISEKDNIYEFKNEMDSSIDTLFIEIITLKYIYKAKINIGETYLSDGCTLKIKFLSYKRFLLPKYYNIVIVLCDGISQPFYARRYKR